MGYGSLWTSGSTSSDFSSSQSTFSLLANHLYSFCDSPSTWSLNIRIFSRRKPNIYIDIIYYDDNLLNVFWICSVLTSRRFITLIPIREDEILCIFYFCEAHLLFIVVKFKLLTLVPLLHPYSKWVVVCIFFPLQKSFGPPKIDLSFIIKGKVKRSELPEVSPEWQEKVATTSILYAQTHTHNHLKKWKPMSTIRYLCVNSERTHAPRYHSNKNVLWLWMQTYIKCAFLN